MDDVLPVPAVPVAPVMDEAERRALVERPARRRRRARIAECYAFGLVLGPIISALVNHGQPALGSAVDAVIILPFLALFAWVAVKSRRYGDEREALVRALVILVFGSALFVLPRSVTLAAFGWPYNSWGVDARWLICAVPYPLIADLIRPGCSRSGRVVPVAGLACLALAWPMLMTEMASTAAAQTRAAIGAPDAMLLLIDPPAPTSARGALYSTGALTLDFDSSSPTPVLQPDPNPDDLDMVVYPAQTASPCSAVPTLANALGVESYVAQDPAKQCRQTAPGLWQYTQLTDHTSTTDIERYGAYYVALTVDSTSTTPVSPATLPALFRTIHHPDNTELAALGESAYGSWI